MRILIDKYIPFIEGVFDAYAEVAMLEPEEFTAETVRDADVLIIRTRTRCNADLLEGSRVQFIATATIGTDHIDLAYCQSRSIKVYSCPGCNAQAVCDYVEEAIVEALDPLHTNLAERILLRNGPLSIGIVGAGHVGKKVIKMALDHGFHVVVNDPFHRLNGDVTGCDIITYHTPLTYDGLHPTYHMCNVWFLAKCKPEALIINAARGGVVDEEALLYSGHPYIIDTWEGEPNINSEVLKHALFASYHIAGYSIKGKRSASIQVVLAICKHFGWPKLKYKKKSYPVPGDSNPGWLQRITEGLKAQPEAFEQLRKQYALR